MQIGYLLESSFIGSYALIPSRSLHFNLLTSDGVSEGEFAVVEEIELGGMKGKSVLQSFI
jgi:hypothetical protein